MKKGDIFSCFGYHILIVAIHLPESLEFNDLSLDNTAENSEPWTTYLCRSGFVTEPVSTIEPYIKKVSHITENATELIAAEMETLLMNLTPDS